MALGKKTGGRQQGSGNALTDKLKDMIEGALDDAGGKAYLAEQAQKCPQAFLALVSKLIPRDLNVSGEIRHTLEKMITEAVQEKAEHEQRVQ